MSLEDFTTLWCRLYDEANLTSHRHSRTSQALSVYIQALVAGLSTEEADEATTYVFCCRRVNLDAYLLLRRRGFERAQAWRIVNCASVNHEHIKYIVEAHRRGATDDAIVFALDQGSICQLALGLRHKAKASADPQS